MHMYIQAYTVLLYVCSFNTANFSQKPFFKSHSFHGRLGQYNLYRYMQGYIIPE